MLQNDDKEKSGGNSGNDMGSNDSPPPTRDGGDYLVKTEQ